MRLDQGDIEAVAQRVAELLANQAVESRQQGQLVDAATVARLLGVSRATVYAKADELGAVRLGNGKKAAAALRSEQAPGARLDQRVRDGCSAAPGPAASEEAVARRSRRASADPRTRSGGGEPAAAGALNRADSIEALSAMPAKRTGEVVVRNRGGGRIFALRFRAYGKRHYLTLGHAADGWTYEKAEEELANVLADVRRGIWKPPTAKTDRGAAGGADLPPVRLGVDREPAGRVRHPDDRGLQARPNPPPAAVLRASTGSRRSRRGRSTATRRRRCASATRASSRGRSRTGRSTRRSPGSGRSSTSPSATT